MTDDDYRHMHEEELLFYEINGMNRAMLRIQDEMVKKVKNSTPEPILSIIDPKKCPNCVNCVTYLRSENDRLKDTLKRYEYEETCAEKPDDGLETLVDQAHPLKTKKHDMYTAALMMVGKRHDKYELVDLVNMLMSLIPEDQMPEEIKTLIAKHTR